MLTLRFDYFRSNDYLCNQIFILKIVIMYQKTKNIREKKDINSPLTMGKKIKRELTHEEEKVAFLYTSKINSSRIFAKYLD